MEILNFYFKNCDRASLDQDVLSFEFGDYVISYRLKISVQEIDNDLRYIPLETLQDLDNALNLPYDLSTLTIQNYEYLGWRQDYEQGRSLSNELYQLVKKLNAIEKDTVVDYNIYIEAGDSFYCDVEPNYRFEVRINDKYLANDRIAQLIISAIKDVFYEVPSFYTNFFLCGSSIPDTRSLHIVSTNTKTRRLGYFKLLATFIKDKSPAFSISKKFESYSSRYVETLKLNTNSKGLIQETKTGSSAKPYIELASNFALIIKINNVFHSGKSFKVYQLLNDSTNRENIFNLSDLDIVYFLEVILKNDYFYIHQMLEIIYLQEQITYSEIKNLYQLKLINSLSRLEKNVYDRKTNSEIQNVLKRIQNWEKPEVYLEHIIMPRLNWLADLKIIDLKSNIASITERGKKLFQHFLIWNDINTNYIISPDGFLERFIIHVFDDCYNQNEVVNPTVDEVKNRIRYYINESFDYFQTLAPNRVTASQAIHYTKYMLYFKDRIKVGYKFVENWLTEQGEFAFRYQEQYQDGYIQKKS